MSVNPFEPPRAADLAGSAEPTTASSLPEAAIGELVASTPWVRWSTRLAMGSVLVSLLNSAVSLGRAPGMKERIGPLTSIVVGIPLAILFVVLFRRYAGHLEALGAGRGEAASGVVEGQRAILKTFGILMIVFMALIPLLIIGGMVGYFVMKGAR
jgi:hypothetical protein